MFSNLQYYLEYKTVQFKSLKVDSKLLSIMEDFKFTTLKEGIGKVYDNFCERYN